MRSRISEYVSELSVLDTTIADVEMITSLDDVLDDLQGHDHLPATFRMVIAIVVLVEMWTPIYLLMKDIGGGGLDVTRTLIPQHRRYQDIGTATIHPPLAGGDPVVGRHLPRIDVTTKDSNVYHDHHRRARGVRRGGVHPAIDSICRK